MNDNSKQNDTSYILSIVKYILHGCKILTPLGIIEKFRNKDNTSRKGVEMYIFLICVPLLMIFCIVLIIPIPNIVKYIFSGLALWRLFDIILTTIRLSFFRTKKDKSCQIPQRNLILIAVNYIEIILIFSILYFIFCGQTFDSIRDSLQFSFEVFVPIVSIPTQTLQISHWLVVLEIVISLIIHIAVIQRILSTIEFKSSHRS